MDYFDDNDLVSLFLRSLYQANFPTDNCYSWSVHLQENNNIAKDRVAISKKDNVIYVDFSRRCESEE